MLIVLVIIFGIAACVFAARFYLLRKNIKCTADELGDITADFETSRVLACIMPDRELERLISHINLALERCREERAGFKAREAEWRRQIANISHDLRTPLTSILGYVGLARERSLDAVTEDCLAVIERRARMLSTLVSQFYELSRIEAGEYPLNMVRVDLRSELAQSLAAFYEELAVFEVSVDLGDSPVGVLADKGAVLRIFSNVIRNALRHGKGGLGVTLRREGSTALVSFSNGADMNADDLSHVFDRFFTADKMRTGQDTGIGLTIVKRLMELMGYEAGASCKNGLFVIELRFKIAS